MVESLRGDSQLAKFPSGSLMVVAAEVILSLRGDPQKLLRNDAEALSPNKQFGHTPSD